MNYRHEVAKRRIAALDAIERGDYNGLSLEDIRGRAAVDGEELPKGTKVVFAEPEQATEELPVAAPRTPQLGARTVQVDMSPPPDTELDDAKEMDAESMRRRLFETATRQLIGGLTRTAPQAALTQETKKAPELLAGRSKAKQEALRQLEIDNQGKRFDFDTQEAARKAALAAKNREEDLAQRGISNENARLGRESRDKNTNALLGLATQGARIRQDEADAKKEDRAAKEAASTFPLGDGMFTIKKGLDDSAANQARAGASKWNTAIGNLDALDGSLGEYVKKPSLEAKATVEAQLQGAMTSLNAALGQGAMAENERAALSSALGADLKSPTAIAAAIESWLSGDAGQAGRLLMTKLRTIRQSARNSAAKSLSPYGEFAGGGASQPQAATSPDEDAAAIAWAKANSKDPRAAEILRLHGVK